MQDLTATPTVVKIKLEGRELRLPIEAALVAHILDRGKGMALRFALWLRLAYCLFDLMPPGLNMRELKAVYLALKFDGAPAIKAQPAIRKSPQLQLRFDP